jgi:two-component system chemotaxis response regulator CheB
MPPIRVLIVDDSVLIREVLGELHADREIEIVGIASSAAHGLRLIASLKPDLVMLDLSLPGLDADETLAEIRRFNPTLPLIVLSTFTERGPAVKAELLAGVTEYVTKSAPGNSNQEVRQKFREQLISKVKNLAARPARLRLPVAVVAAAQGRARAQIDIVVIGASTGGPEALAELIPKFPADFPVPIVIVQHMPAMFTRLLAERLNSLTSLVVNEAQEGEKLAPGQVSIAPGDYHIIVDRRKSEVVLSMNQHVTEQGCRPSVDVLFRSAAKTFGAHVLAVVLTGMGADGTSGAQAIWEAGGEVLVQDEATSAIWGMPGRVVAAGLADCVYSLGSMSSEVVRRVYARRPVPILTRAAVAR